MGKHKHYSVELKQQVVMEYLSGDASMLELCKKYDINEKNEFEIG